MERKEVIAVLFDKTNKMSCVPSEDSAQISLVIHPVWSESRCLHEDSMGP